MLFSGRQIIVPLLLLLIFIVSAHAQPAVDKASSSTISGKVTIGSKGLSGVVVALADEVPYASIHITNMKAVTDEEGNYQIKNVPPGSYKVMVAAPAYVPSDWPTQAVVGKNENVENVDITLLRGGVITGKVVDADGRSVVEEEVYFTSTTQTRGLSYLRRIRTDDRGVYRAFGLAAGRYLVYAGRDSVSSFGRAETGYQQTYHPSGQTPAEATPIQVTEGSEATNVDITLGHQSSKYSVRGRIIDGETSKPLLNEHIGIQMFFDRNGSTSKSDAAESTKDGEFKIENLPPGKYSVYLESPPDSPRFSEPVLFEVTDHDVEGLIIKTSQGGTASGIVVLEGTNDPAVRANLLKTQISLFLSDQLTRRTKPYVNINPDASFRVTGLPAGHLILALPENRDHLQLMRIERDGVVYRNSIDIKEREQITGLRVVVSQANGTIRGVLKLPKGLQLSATNRVLVWVRRIEDPNVNIAPVEADARGQFVVQHLIAGTYEFNVRLVGAPGDQLPTIPRPTQTVLVANGEIADVSIALQMPIGPGGP